MILFFIILILLLLLLLLLLLFLHSHIFPPVTPSSFKSLIISPPRLLLIHTKNTYPSFIYF
ncbi:hypothetical protein BCR42DRAFT_413996 [Absidia repens]|uniref:Uncharacterized protein n=1 Tax=Absidia repens TaxID=90262 RepID=A0A1X2IIJ7_9FUNG|nr:hypothetical protein BCR42DRAFT_413996 [Absidia repens]